MDRLAFAAGLPEMICAIVACLTLAAEPAPATLPASMPVNAPASVPVAAPSPHRFGLGIELGVPGDGSGIPLQGYALHLPIALTARYWLYDWLAIDGGIGVPIAGIGASLWADAAFCWFAIGHRASALSLSLFAAPGFRFGFVGVEYYAWKSHVFVGFGYLYSGPLTLAPHLSLGVQLGLAHGRVGVFAEAIPELSLLPSPEPLLGGVLGARYFF